MAIRVRYDKAGNKRYNAEVFIGLRPSRKTGKLINAYDRATFATLKEAKLWEANHRVSKSKDPNHDPNRAKQPFKDLAEQWLLVKKPRLAPRSYDRAAQVIRKHLIPTFGSMPVSAITFEIWRDHLARLAAEENDKGEPRYASGTLHRIHGAMTSVMEEARTRGILSANPCRRAARDVIPPPVRKMTFLTAGEIRSLADAIDPHYRVLVLTAGFSGLRAGELAALQRQDIAFETARAGDAIELTGATITVARAIKTWRNRKPVIGTTKTGKVRTVDLSPEMGQVLWDHLEQRPANPDGLVFTNSKTGGVLNHSSFYRAFWRPAVKAALPHYADTLRFHDLRHSFISLLLAAGVDVLEVAGQAGHQRAEMTLNVYGHRMPSGRDKVRKALSAAWSEAESPNVTALPTAVAS
jgi:integrase